MTEEAKDDVFEALRVIHRGTTADVMLLFVQRAVRQLDDALAKGLEAGAIDRTIAARGGLQLAYLYGVLSRFVRAADPQDVERLALGGIADMEELVKRSAGQEQEQEQE